MFSHQTELMNYEKGVREWYNKGLPFKETRALKWSYWIGFRVYTCGRALTARKSYKRKKILKWK